MNGVPKTTLALALTLCSSGAFAACTEPQLGGKSTPMFSPPLSTVVVGTGRLHVYSAPDRGCAMARTFVVPGDRLVAYGRSGEWSSVMYSNPRTGETVSGWVHSARLKSTGTIGPRQ